MRRRLTLLSGLAVAVSVVIASLLAYFAVAHQLRDEVDDSLRGSGRMAVRLSERGPGGPQIFQKRLEQAPGGVPGVQGATEAPPPIPLGGPRQNAQIVTSNGDVLGRVTANGSPIPQKKLYQEVAAGEHGATFTDVDANGEHLRVYAQPIGDGIAFVSARSVEEIDHVLNQLRWLLLFVVIGGTALAALLGRAVADASIAPITRLEEGARHVADTNDLTRRIEVGGPEETQSLAIQFNNMLAALETSAAALGASLESQRRLIADTSHELRTPITSLRTNIEVLHSIDRLDATERTDLLDEVEGELQELGALIEDVIELARGDEPGAESAPELEPVRLDTLVAEIADRVHRHWPGIEFALETDETRIQGTPDRARPRRPQPARQRGQVEPARRHRRGDRARRRGRRARPRRRHSARGAGPDLRPVLPRAGRRGAARVRPRARDRAPGGRLTRGHGDGGERRWRRCALHAAAAGRGAGRHARDLSTPGAAVIDWSILAPIGALREQSIAPSPYSGAAAASSSSPAAARASASDRNDSTRMALPSRHSIICARG